MNATTNRCNLCGCTGGHQNGCSNRQGNEGHTYHAGSQDMYRSFVERREMRVIPLKNLLEAAEEMCVYCDGRDNRWPEWKAAIDAARKEVGS